MSNMSNIPKVSLWIDFFAMYQELPALWKIRDPVYRNKTKRKQAHDKLLEYYQKIDPKANVDSMRRRLNGIRTCYRRELRKVEHSQLSAPSADDVYVPHLWYFSQLSFLRDQDIRVPQLSSTTQLADSYWNEEDEDENMEKPNDEQNDESNTTTEFSEGEVKFQPTASADADEVTKEPAFPDLSRSSLSQSISQMPQLSQNLDNSVRDEAAIYAESWAMSYRKLNDINRLLAKKAIEEILFLGQIDKLEICSVKMPN